MFSEHVDGIVAVGLDASGSSVSLIDLLPIVLVPDSPSARLQREMLCEPFRVPEESLGVKGASDLKVVFREDELYGP